MFKPGTVMYARAAKNIVRYNCEFCGRELTPQQGITSGICDNPECHALKIEKVGAELIERKRQENAQALDKAFAESAPQVAKAIEAIAATPETIARTKLPYQENSLQALPSERREAFEKHLRWIAARAFTEAVPDADLTYRDAIELDQPDVMDAACARCKGGCCALGGDTGFLQDEDVGRMRQRNPEVSEEEVVDAYLALVPEEAISESCVYHGAEGCALPRAMRNNQCNTFYCKPLRTLRDLLSEGSTDKVVMIAVDEAGAARSVTGWSPETGAVDMEAVDARPTPESPGPIVFSSDDF